MLRYKFARIMFLLTLGVVAFRAAGDLVRFLHLVAPSDPLVAALLGPWPESPTVTLGIAAASWVVVAVFSWTLYPIIRDGRLPTIDDSVLLPAPPPDLTPAMTVVLRTGRADKEAFVAAVADLIHRGLISVAPDLTVVVPATSSTTSPSAAGFGEAEIELLRRFEIDAGEKGVFTYERARSGIGWQTSDYFCGTLSDDVARSPWMNQNPSWRMRLWPRVGLAMAAVGCLPYALASYGVGSLNSDLLWALPWVILSGLLVAFGSYEVYFHRTKTGAYHYAMAIAYQNTLRYALQESPLLDRRVSLIQARMEWCRTPEEMVVWALALGFGDQGGVDPSKVPGRSGDNVLTFESMDWLRWFCYTIAARPDKGTRSQSGTGDPSAPVYTSPAGEAGDRPGTTRSSNS
jgi:hypothetical protein